MKTKVSQMKVIAILFMAILAIIANVYLINFKSVSGLIGSDWLTTGNTGLLAVCGVQWWHNHTLLIAIQIFVLLLIFVFSNGLCWGLLLLLESFAFLGYFILNTRHKNLEYKTESLMENMITLLSFDEYLYQIKWSAAKTLLAMAGIKLVFFIATPVIIVLWLIKWFATGISFALKPVV